MSRRLSNLFDAKRFNFGGVMLVWVIAKIAGVVPYVTRYQKYQVSYIQLAYVLACGGLYGMCFYFAVLVSPLETAQHLPQIAEFGHILHFGFGLFIYIVCFLMSILQTDYITSLTQKGLQIDRRLYQITGQKNNYHNMANRFEFFCCVYGFLIYVGATVLDGFIAYERYGINTIYVLFSYVYPYFVAIAVQFQFIASIYNILLRIKTVNKCFDHIANINETTSKAVKMFKSSEEEDNKTNDDKTANKTDTPVLFIVGHSFEDRLNSNEKSPPKKISNAFENTMKRGKNKIGSTKSFQLNQQSHLPINLHKDMDSLFDLHDNLLDLSEQINIIYAIQIVAFVTASFVLMLFGFFFETKVIFWFWAQSTHLLTTAMSYMIWATFAGSVIYTILNICTRTREEAYESALIIHKILQNKPIFMLNDEIYYNKMKSFTLQVLHRKNTFNFNGLGLFQLDYTFIFSAVSAATSYLIVLLQFDLSSDLIQN